MATRRAAELGIEFCYQGSEAKDEVLAQLLVDSGRSPEAIAHMGDDLADLKIMAAWAWASPRPTPTPWWPPTPT